MSTSQSAQAAAVDADAMPRPPGRTRVSSAGRAWNARFLHALILLALLATRAVGATPAVTPLSPPPADGSGSYRIALDGLADHCPLLLLVEVAGGKAVGTICLGVHRHPTPFAHPVLGSELALADGRLQGSVRMRYLPSWPLASGNDARSPALTAYRLDAAPEVVVAVDVPGTGSEGVGTFTVTEGPASKYHPAAKGCTGVARVRRQAPAALPADYEIDLMLHAGIVEPTRRTQCYLRLAMRGGALAEIGNWTAFDGRRAPVPLVISERQVAFDGRGFTARFAATSPDKPSFTWELTGTAVGRYLAGTVRFVQGGTTVDSTWHGCVNATAWRWPTVPPMNTWDWEHDQPADAALAAQAARESLEPVLPGEPGKYGFWTWRRLVNHGVSCIHPPSFGLEETAGAASYRYAVTATHDGAVKALGFTADKPWRPLTPIWQELDSGPWSCELVVTPLDAAGKELPGPMRLRVLDRKTAEWTTEDRDRLAFTKRPSFAGPYVKPALGYRDAALALARWHRQEWGIPQARGLASHGWQELKSEGSFASAITLYLWLPGIARRLSNDPVERAVSEDLLAFALEEVEAHQALSTPPGIIYEYRGFTPVTQYPVQAILDAYTLTGDTRWKEAALRYARALVSLQNENGSFSATYAKGHGPEGFFSWRIGNKEFGAAESLYFLGRARVDLQTEEFVEAERKSLKYIKDIAVPQRFFPLYVHHTLSQGYPIWQHAISGLHIARYLLEYAQPEDRDLALATAVARWAEDVGVDWQRTTGRQDGAILPQIRQMDRINNSPLAVNLVAAIVFERLARATGDRLWSAKGEALARAVLLAFDPQTGRANISMEPKSEDPLSRAFLTDSHEIGQFCKSWAAGLLVEYDRLRAEAR